MSIRRLNAVFVICIFMIALWAPTVLATPTSSDIEPLVGEMITRASSDITGSGNKIEGKASTTANKLCSKIGALFTLQKWNGSAWEDYKTASQYLSTVARATVAVSFSAGAGTYRLKVNHRLYSGSVVKTSLTTYTGSVSLP